jgi:hypothetical protein
MSDVRVTVLTDNEPEHWRQVEDLREAGADDAVFVLDRYSGEVRFGDGEHGRRPADGAVVRASYFNGRRLKAGDLTVEQVYQREPTSRPATGKIVQIMPADGWMLTERSTAGEATQPLVGWALLDPPVPLYRNGGDPPPVAVQAVRGLVVGPAGTVQLVDELAPSFGGYRQ